MPDESSSTDFGVEAPYRSHHLLNWCRYARTSSQHRRTCMGQRNRFTLGHPGPIDIDAIWRVMRACVDHGCTSAEPTLPGGLDVPCRARRNVSASRLEFRCAAPRQPAQRRRAPSLPTPHGWISSLAVSEENAGGGRIVTRSEQRFRRHHSRRASLLLAFRWTTPMNRAWSRFC